MREIFRFKLNPWASSDALRVISEIDSDVLKRLNNSYVNANIPHQANSVTQGRNRIIKDMIDN